MTQMPDLENDTWLTPLALGQEIRAARKRAGLRLDEAALHLELSKQTLQNLEKGSSGVAMGTALRVAANFGVRLRIVGTQSGAGHAAA